MWVYAFQDISSISSSTECMFSPTWNSEVAPTHFKLHPCHPASSVVSGSTGLNSSGCQDWQISRDAWDLSQPVKGKGFHTYFHHVMFLLTFQKTSSISCLSTFSAQKQKWHLTHPVFVSQCCGHGWSRWSHNRCGHWLRPLGLDVLPKFSATLRDFHLFSRHLRKRKSRESKAPKDK